MLFGCAITAFVLAGCRATPPAEEVANASCPNPPQVSVHCTVAVSPSAVVVTVDQNSGAVSPDARGGVTNEPDQAAVIWTAFGKTLQVSALVDESTPEGPRPTVAAYHGVPAVPNVEQWRGLVSAYFPPHAVEGALRVMACESGGRADAISRTADYGLMQIHYAAHWDKTSSPQALLDPAENLRVAALIYNDSGWLPWSCRP